MYTFMKNVFRYKLRNVYRFVHTETELKNQIQWLKPAGYETNITIYNPITKCNVPLILKNKNYLTWYVCGPTVYDSAHIGHAVTYLNTDIIRRILSHHFDINILMVMCITDIDDKIINRAKELKQDYNSVTKYYENEFIEDMKMLNIVKPDLYCRVTDYIPQIIAFVKRIVDKGDAYIWEDGSVYFNTNRYGMYGKFKPAVIDTVSSDKKSPTDFCLWKVKNSEPFWESPWGPGRPGWHIECSTIASTVFGNSIDIHSGGADLLFPHHENEEAQSCSYHEVKQWVNYWLHSGHLTIRDEKMSKSLGNTISIRKFLEKYTANHLRILCLLCNYRNGLIFSNTTMEIAVATLHKIEHFISDCDNYIAGRWVIGNIDEVALLRCLEETKANVKTALADNFNTTQAMASLTNLINVTNKMLHDSEAAKNNCTYITPIAAVSNYVWSTLSSFGVTNSTTADDQKINNLMECIVNFRRIVRNRALEGDVKDKILLAACDELRSNLSLCGVTIKDQKTETVWSINKY